MSTSISKTMSDQSTIIILSDKESSLSSSPSSGSESRTCFGAFFLSIGFCLQSRLFYLELWDGIFIPIINLQQILLL